VTNKYVSNCHAKLSSTQSSFVPDERTATNFVFNLSNACSTLFSQSLLFFQYASVVKTKPLGIGNHASIISHNDAHFPQHVEMSFMVISLNHLIICIN
jgi:hypothetical protein